MKRIVSVVLVLFIIALAGVGVCAQTVPDSYMELSVTGDWHIFSKDMTDEALLDAVDMSASDINKILEDSGSESLIINSATGAQVFVKVHKNELSRQLWNIQETDNAYIMENVGTILADGFNVTELDYIPENVAIKDSAYLKQVSVYGSTFYSGTGHGIVVSGTFVNGYAVVFMMESADVSPTEEEVLQVNELMSGVSFTVIKDKDISVPDEAESESDVFTYILGGFGALVVIIFCAYMIERLRHKEEISEETKEE